MKTTKQDNCISPF